MHYCMYVYLMNGGPSGVCMSMYVSKDTYVFTYIYMNACIYIGSICKKATSTETLSGVELGKLLGSFFVPSDIVGVLVLL